LESRLKYIQIDAEASNKKVTENDKKIRAMEAEIAKNQPIADELERKVKEKVRSRRTCALRSLGGRTARCSFLLCSSRWQSDAVAATTADLAKREEKIFRDFSRRVGMANIREFENARLKLAEQYNAEKVRLTTEVNNLQNQLDYERNRDLEKSIKIAQQRIKDLEAKKRQAEESEKKVQAELDKEKEKLDELLEESKKVGKEMERKQQELKDAKKKGEFTMRAS
jgi:chromosome segregation ATPase